MTAKKVIKKAPAKKAVTRKPAKPRTPKKKNFDKMSLDEIEREGAIALAQQRIEAGEKIRLDNEVKKGVLISKDKASMETAKIIKEYDDNISKLFDMLPEILYSKSKKDIQEILFKELERSRENYKNYISGLINAT